VPKVGNLFDLLNNMDEAGDDEDEDDQDIQNYERDTNNILSSSKDEAKGPIDTTSSDIKSKKKKRKSKKKDKPKTAEHAWGVDCPQEAEQLDEIDMLCRQIEGAGGSKGVAKGERSTGDSEAKGPPLVGGKSVQRPLLSVDMRHLKAEDELKRIFGRRVIASESQAMKAEGQRQRGVQARGAGQRASKKTVIVTARDNWPRVQSGLSMEVVGTDKGARVFNYTHNVAYLMVQQEYEDCVAAHDPNLLAQLVAKHPYHVDALLALVEVYQQMNELNTAQELLERCMYGLECAWHPGFAPATGTARLPYASPENRPFFTTLFKHIQNLGRKGCHRSAMECCKLLLSVDPQDPMGVLGCIDYYAIMAEQYGFVLQLVNEFEACNHPLALRPGTCFSSSLARFRLEEKAGRAGTSARNKEVGGGDDAAGEERADAALREALLLHPSCVHRLIERLNEKSNAVVVDRDWSRILGHPHFATKPQDSASLERLVSIFVERHHLLWRPPEVQAWLKSSCSKIVEEIDRGEGGSTGAFGGGSASDLAAVCAETFPAFAEDDYKHLATSSFSDAISILPPEENPFAQGADMGPNGMPEGHAMPGNMPVPPLRLAPADLQGGNAIFEFIRTLMPWVNVDQLDQAQVDAIRQELQEVVEGNQGDHHGRNPPLNDHEQD